MDTRQYGRKCCVHRFDSIFQSLPVTLRTARFNTQEFYVVTTLRLYVLYGSQEQAANFSLYIIHRLDFITEVESVYSAVRTESLYNTDTFPV